MNFDASKVIETNRLILRYMTVSDTEAIFNNINHDREVLTYFIDKYRDDISEMTLDKTIEFCLLNQRYLFAIELKESHEVIGMILQCSTPTINNNCSEIGYAIGKKYWNNGYVTEALKAMIDFLFSIGIHKVVAAYLIGNNASKRVMEKCHMIHEGIRKDEIYYRDQYHDVDYYYLIK